jgi:hypothetical protein
MRRRLPWLLLGAWGLVTAVSSVLNWRQGDELDAVGPLAVAVLAGVGAMLAARRPVNPIGWLLLGIAVIIGLAELATVLADRSASETEPGLGARLLVWFDNWALQLWLGVIGIAVPLLFPDGRLPSRRWRRLAWPAAAVVVVAVLGVAFGSPRLDVGPEATVANPLALGGAVGAVLREAGGVASGGLVEAMMLGALASVAVRLRRSTGVERQQLKWFAYAIGLLLWGLLTAVAANLAGVDPLAIAGWAVFLVSVAVGLPVAIAVAILRYRLYDIDVVINRTLVYGGLSATLGGAYLGLVLLAGLTIGESDLATALSTLAVAALFGPARGRIQAAVDRRFYRRRYDAERTLEAFGGRLRDELDLETLGDDLRGVVTETVQPAHVSLWLRGRA